MSDGSQKTPIARTLEQFGHRKASAAISLLGKSLPASVVSRAGSIVTVKFEVQSAFTLPNISVPMIGSEYVRVPVQAGCKGWVIPSDAFLGGMSGLGSGVADLSQRANLSALVWSPIGNTAFDAADDENALVLYGPDGVIIRSLQKETVLTITADGAVLKLPTGKLFEVQGNLKVDGNIISNGNLQIGGNIQDVAGGTYAGNLHTTGTVTGDTAVKSGNIDLAAHHHLAPDGNTGPALP